uniref:C2 domain-containing protein n=2 Tax=Caniformia TaxID=379584 RepID=A0A8C0K3X4_CANLU
MTSGSMKFNGYLRVRIGEAVGLQPTRWSLRHSLFKKGYQLLDPYLTVSVDQVRVGQTSTKQKTNKPTYNEEFCANVTDGGHLELAVFHETPLGYDHFVANCTLQFQELLRTAGASDTFEGWVSGRGGSRLCPLASLCPLHFSKLTWVPLPHPVAGLPGGGIGTPSRFWSSPRWPRPW